MTTRSHLRITSRLLIIIATLLLVAGCIPQRIGWSPDGSIAYVLADDGLRFCDIEGNLTDLRAAGIKSAVWTPDGKQLVIEGEATFESWGDFAEHLDKWRSDQIIERATAACRHAVTGRPWDDAVELVRDTFAHPISDNEVDAWKLYIRDNFDDEDDKQLIASWGEVDSVKLDLIAVADYRDGDIGEPRFIAASTEDVFSLILSPDGEALLYTTVEDLDDDEARGLHVVLLTGGPSAQLNHYPGLYADWTPDSRSAVYFQQEQNSEALGELLRQTVRDEHGKLDTDDGHDVLAGCLFAVFARPTCLSDGRIVFNSVEITLPLTENDVPQQQQLFMLDPGRHAALVRLIPRGFTNEMPEDLSYYTVSPDESRLACLAESGHVHLFDLATGEVEVIQDIDFDDNYSLPAWRTANEITVTTANPDGLPGTHEREIVHIKLDKDDRKVLSADWPDAAVGGWLGTHEEDEED